MCDLYVWKASEWKMSNERWNFCVYCRYILCFLLAAKEKSGSPNGTRLIRRRKDLRSESTELLLRTFLKKILKHWEHDVLCRLYVSSVEWFWTEVPSSATLLSGEVTKLSTKDTRASTSVCVLMRRITSWKSLRSFITTLRSSTAISEVWVS